MCVVSYLGVRGRDDIDTSKQPTLTCHLLKSDRYEKQLFRGKK
ncbi:MAG: hypothetical protein AB4063_15535 [Crocosphaera sp.]